MSHKLALWQKGEQYDIFTEEVRRHVLLFHLNIEELSEKASVSRAHLYRFRKGKGEFTTDFLSKVIKAIVEDANYLAIENDRFMKSSKPLTGVSDYAYDSTTEEIREMVMLSRLTTKQISIKSSVSITHLHSWLRGERNISNKFITKIIKVIIEDANYQSIENKRLKKLIDN